MTEQRPPEYPTLQHYQPSPFMLPDSHYDAALADRAVTFIENLRHTKGKWAGKRFWLLPWQEQIIRDLFGILRPDNTRQFHMAYIEIPKKNGKSELAAAIALYLLFGDNEPAAEVGTKHGLNVSGLVFDELHAQPNRKLWDVLTNGSGDARTQPLFVTITTAGTDRHSICYEQHQLAADLLAERKYDPTFYPVIYGLPDGADWKDEQNWYRANPSLGITIPIERVREAFQKALRNPEEENQFKQLRLNLWVSSLTSWISDAVFCKGNAPIDEEALLGRECYGGLDLSSTSDITAFVLVFPPQSEEEPYIVLPYFWLPEETLPLRVARDHVPYDRWEQQGYLQTTEGNVVHYGYIERFIDALGQKFHIKEIAYDRWGAVQMVQNLEGLGFTVIPFGQGFRDMSPPSKEFYKLLLEGNIQHGGNPILRWMAGNVVTRSDPAQNIKPDKAKSTEKIDGIVATIMALDRAIRHSEEQTCVYDERELLVL